MAKDVDEVIARLQRNARVRQALAGLLVVALLALLGYFAWGLIPRHYTLRITGGEILGNRHYLARVLAQESKSRGVTLIVDPTAGTFEALEQVSRGKLDLALIQGGLSSNYPNVQHVATVTTEILHLLVGPGTGIAHLHDLRGKTVNVGPKGDGTQVIVDEVMRFAGLEEHVDYAPTTYSSEELTGMRPGRLPDAAFVLSTAPSYVAEYLVKKRGFEVLEIPFPPALALKYGWVADEKILAYTYNVSPPVPKGNIESLGVNMHLVANAKANPEAVFRVLTTLYSSDVANRLLIRIDPARMLVPSGYPISQGTHDYVRKDDPVISVKNMQLLYKEVGALLTFIGAAAALRRWLKGPEEVVQDDEEWQLYMTQIAELEKEIAEGANPRATAAKLAELRVQVLSRTAGAKLADPWLKDGCLACLNSARAHLDSVLGANPDRSGETGDG